MCLFFWKGKPSSNLTSTVGAVTIGTDQERDVVVLSELHSEDDGHLRVETLKVVVREVVGDTEDEAAGEGRE